MPQWIRVLLSTPERPLSPLGRYTQWNGFLYLALGFLIYAWPGVMGLVGAAPLHGQEPALYRLIGFAIAIVGYLYVFGGRTDRDSFGLATFLDRILVPLFIVPPVLAGDVDPVLVLPFAILDPILGIGAFVIWKRQSSPAD